MLRLKIIPFMAHNIILKKRIEITCTIAFFKRDSHAIIPFAFYIFSFIPSANLPCRIFITTFPWTKRSPLTIDYQGILINPIKILVPNNNIRK